MNAQPSVVVTVESIVDPLWIEFCTKDTDVFLRGYCGYWATGMEIDDTLGWLIYEHGGERHAPASTRKSVLETWRAGKELPERWHRLDFDAAKRAWCEGVKRHGIEWYETGDGPRYDDAIQLAVLGEIRYG